VGEGGPAKRGRMRAAARANERELSAKIWRFESV
jgi:hypothetical protein